MKNLAMKSSLSAFLTVLGAVAAGMFFFGSKGRTQRAYVKEKTEQTKKEIREKLDQLKNIDVNSYFDVLDSLFDGLEDATSPSS